MPRKYFVARSPECRRYDDMGVACVGVGVAGVGLAGVAMAGVGMAGVSVAGGVTLVTKVASMVRMESVLTL